MLKRERELLEGAGGRFKAFGQRPFTLSPLNPFGEDDLSEGAGGLQGFFRQPPIQPQPLNLFWVKT